MKNGYFRKVLSSLVVLSFFSIEVGTAQDIASSGLHSFAHSAFTEETPRHHYDLKEALMMLGAEYGVAFSYKNQTIAGKKVDSRIMQDIIGKRTVDEILRILLEPQGLQFEKVENIYLIYFSQENSSERISGGEVTRLNRRWLKESSPTFPARQSASGPGGLQQVQVSGRVVSGENSEPIPGVNIIVQGTTLGTVTDVNGAYVLNVPSGKSVLVFSFIGFVQQTVEVGISNVINIVLDTDAKALDEVVITALGIPRDRAALGYAVQEVDGEKLTAARETNLVNALAGRVAGVNVGRVPGPVGSSGRIVIRGENSLTGNNQALFVVDGVPIDNEMRANRGQLDFGNGAGEINPDDIQSISVLKGPAAAALYGSRAGNGVVLITTKRGKSGRGIGVSVNSTSTFEQPLIRWSLQDEYGQGSGGIYTVGLGGRSWGPRFNPDTLIAQVDRTQFPLEGQDGSLQPWIPNPDNVLGFFRTGRTLTNNIAYAGSSDRADYRVSYTNLHQQSMAPNMSLKRNTLQLNAGFKVTPKLEMRTSMSYINTDSPNRTGSGGQGNGNLMYSFLTGGRQTDLERIRNYWVEGYEGLQQWNPNFRVMNNPYFSVYEITNSQLKNRLLGNILLKYDFTKELSLMVRTGMDLYFDERESKHAFSSLENPNGLYSEDKLLFNERNSDFLLSYDKSLAGNFNLKISAGGNRMYTKVNMSSISANNLNIPGIYNLGNVNGLLQGSNTLTKRRTNSLYGFVNLAYKDMIYLDITGRNDWSSTLPPQNNSYFYPSASLSILLSDVFQLPADNVLSFAKVRTSVAQVGNDIAPYQIVQNFNYGTPWGGIQTLTESATIENADLKPEIATNYELGLDLRFLKNRVRLDATYYHNISRNQILAINMIAPTGYSSKRINAGMIESKGFEIVLGGTPLDLKDGFKWDINVNWSRNRSYVVELAEGIEQYGMAGGGSATILARVGGLMGDIYARDLLRNENGAVIYRNGNPQFTVESIKLGNYNPDWMAGISNVFSYKMFMLSALFDFRYGGKIYSHAYRMGRVWGQFEDTLLGRDGIVGDGVKEQDGEWVPNDVEITGENYWGNGVGMMTRAGTAVLDASFVKFRELQFGYQLPPALLQKFGIQGMSVSLVGRNLFLWTETPDIDPDNVQINGSNFSPGEENIAFPNARSIGVNLKFNF